MRPTQFIKMAVRFPTPVFKYYWPYATGGMYRCSRQQSKVDWFRKSVGADWMRRSFWTILNTFLRLSSDEMTRKRRESAYSIQSRDWKEPQIFLASFGAPILTKLLTQPVSHTTSSTRLALLPWTPTSSSMTQDTQDLPRAASSLTWNRKTR